MWLIDNFGLNEPWFLPCGDLTRAFPGDVPRNCAKRFRETPEAAHQPPSRHARNDGTQSDAPYEAIPSAADGGVNLEHGAMLRTPPTRAP
jgi:hypothetical protein